MRRKVLTAGLACQLIQLTEIEEEEKVDKVFKIQAPPQFKDIILFDENKKLGKGGKARKRSKFKNT